jgi:hypothetical protein
VKANDEKRGLDLRRSFPQGMFNVPPGFIGNLELNSNVNNGLMGESQFRRLEKPSRLMRFWMRFAY